LIPFQNTRVFQGPVMNSENNEVIQNWEDVIQVSLMGWLMKSREDARKSVGDAAGGSWGESSGRAAWQ